MSCYLHAACQEETLEIWMKIIDKQPFATTPEPLQLIDVVTSLVSRAQLLEWGTKIKHLFTVIFIVWPNELLAFSSIYLSLGHVDSMISLF